MGGSADKRDWNKLNAGGDKKGREVEFSREEFPNNLQTVTVAVEEGSEKRDNSANSVEVRKKHRCDYVNETGCSSDYWQARGGVGG